MVLVAGCGTEDASFDYPRDDEPAFQHVQAKGTHNS